MALLKSNGIVVRSVKYGESSLILEILTETDGLTSFIVSGVRKKKGATASLYRPMQQLSIVHYPSKGESLARIKEVKLSYHYNQLLSDVPTTALGNFLIECTQKVAKEKDIKSRFYGFLIDSLLYIDQYPTEVNNYHLYFISKLAELCGYEIEENYSEVNCFFDITQGNFTSHEVIYELYRPDQELARLLYFILSSEEYQLQTLKLSRDEKYAFLDMMLAYFGYHVPGFTRPKSLDVFKVVFG